MGNSDKLSLKGYLSQQYPYEERKGKIILPVSVFVALFMLVFQPFGLSEFHGEYKMVMLAGYGLVTFLVLSIDLWIIPVLFPATFREENWQVYKELIFLLFILFTVGLANLLYSSWLLGFHLTLINILIFQAYTLAIGIIPITAITLIKQNYLNRKYRENAETLSSGMKNRHPGKNMANLVRIKSDNEKDNIEVMLHDLVFIKSDGNYITVGHLKDGKPVKVLLRSTLKYAVNILSSFPEIFQCHRSWLVNLDRVSRVSGNSQGLRLLVEGFGIDIPVARNKAAGLRRLMMTKQD